MKNFDEKNLIPKREHVINPEQERQVVISKLNPDFRDFFEKVDMDIYKVDLNNTVNKEIDAKKIFLKDKKHDPSNEPAFHLQEIIEKINFSETLDNAVFIRFKIGDLLGQLKSKDVYEEYKTGAEGDLLYKAEGIRRADLDQLLAKIGFKKVSPREAVEFIVEENQNLIKEMHDTKIYMDPINLKYSYPYETMFNIKLKADQDFDFTLDFNKDRLYPHSINDNFAFIRNFEKILLKIPS